MTKFKHFLKFEFEMSINNVLEYENKEQKEIKEKKSDGDDNDWGK